MKQSSPKNQKKSANDYIRIAKRANWRTLYLHDLSLEEVPIELTSLQALEFLDLSKNSLTGLPKEFARLSKIVGLNLSENQFAEIPDEVFFLKHLRYLDLGENNISQISEKIINLQELEQLDISFNLLERFSEVLANLKSLKRLNLNSNYIESIPREIQNLTKLERLNIGDNRLSKLPDEIGNLKKLREISIGHAAVVDFRLRVNEAANEKVGGYQLLSVAKEVVSDDVIKIGFARIESKKHRSYPGNKISELPASMKNMELDKANFEDNNLPIPPEIVSNMLFPNSILRYYFLKSRPIYQAKLIVIGQGSVGKTSVIRRLLTDTFSITEIKTEGINIERWQVKCFSTYKDPPSKIILNLWDFGGQEIMHATHQFFLTKRSLYLLVLDSRLTQEENRVEYWLKIIQSFGGESPVLLVGNKIDQHPLDIDRTGLQKKYPNIVGILETSAATGAGIEALKTAIAEQVNKLPHVRDLLPETWFTVKTKLEGLGRESNFITHDKYLELCAENEVSDETSQRTLIGFLHDLGVVLHFQDDPRLEALGILNPQWVTNGVYKILNSHTLFQNKGVLTVAMLDEILNLPEYPRGKRLFIVDMMKKFELCYDIEPDKTFLVPDLLPKDEPQLTFHGIPAFEYAYPVLPTSVITRFIVRMNQKIDDGFVWRTGVLLKIGENHALVKADIEDKKITIAIDGLEHTRRDALSAIRFQLDEIHASIKGLNPEKFVPVPETIHAKPLKYDYLLKLERAGKVTLDVEDGDGLKEVNITQMLNGVQSEYERRDTGGNVTNIKIGNITIGENAKVGDIVLASKIQESFNKAESADIQSELKETLKQLAEAVTVMTKELPKDQAAEVADDLGKLVDEATKPKPNKKWYSVSVDGLVKAAENLGKVGEPVVNLAGKVLALLASGQT